VAFRDNPLGRLVRTKPRDAARAISEVLVAQAGAIAPTAKALGVDGATLRRWVARLKQGGFEVGPVRSPGNPSITEAQKRGHRTMRQRARQRAALRKTAAKKAVLRKKSAGRKKELAMRA